MQYICKMIVDLEPGDKTIIASPQNLWKSVHPDVRTSAQREKIAKIVQKLIFSIFSAKWKYVKTKLNFPVYLNRKMKLTSLGGPRGT